jgi:hypothetical protein
VGLTASSASAGVKGAAPGLGWRTDPVPWVAALFLTTFAFQRITVPGLAVPITVPLAIGWVVLVAALRLVEFNRIRLLAWLTAAGVSGLMIIFQTIFLIKPFVSLNSWALWLVIWLPVVIQLRRRDAATFLRFCRCIGNIGVGLAALSLLFIGSQLAGIRYFDWLATVVPSSLLVSGFNTSYPFVYGSTLYKSNGWIALEPSFMSFFLGTALICGLIARLGVAQFLIIIAGLVSTGAGSGLALVAVFILILAAKRQLGGLRRYLLPSCTLALLLAITGVGATVFGRVTEVSQQNSSASLRAIEPYKYLWPTFIADPVGIFIGHGPGSSVRDAGSINVVGLLVPNVVKVMYDYGVVAGSLLVALMASTYLRGQPAAFALSLAASTLLLQGPAQPIIACSIIAVALWSPLSTTLGVPSTHSYTADSG